MIYKLSLNFLFDTVLFIIINYDYFTMVILVVIIFKKKL